MNCIFVAWRREEREMNRKAGSGIMLTLLLISMFTAAFNISVTLALNVQHVSSELQTILDPACAPSWQIIEAGLRSEWNAGNETHGNVGVPRKLDLRSTEELRRFARCDGDSVELVVGVDVPELQARSLKEMIFKKGGKVTSTISMRGDIKTITVLVPIKDAYTFAQELRANGLVKYVEPNFRVEAFFTPNDPYWPDQWGPKKVEADVAWNITVGSSDVLVAIVDTGIDYTHADLAANYVSLGHDWVNDDSDSLDDSGHGTHCAGIVAAIINNGIGIAGLAQVHVMAEKVLDMEGGGYSSWVVQGIYHAVDVGAKIISMSFGSFVDSLSVHDAIKYAYDHGVLLIAAAGNTGDDWPNYPAAYDEVVAVSATDPTDNIAEFSTYGRWIELAAPGVNIYSTLPTYNVTLNEPPYNRTLKYDYLSGTSMACPHVAGVASLVWSAFPDCSHHKIRQILRLTSDDLGDAGFDEFYGYGRVNAKKATAGLPEHDLSITRWRHPYRISPGQFGMFNATISNYGLNNETNVSVQFFVNETLTDAKTIDLLESDALTTVTFSWGATTEGSYNVTCYVVPVPEENYVQNNIVSTIVFVRPTITLRVPSEYTTISQALDNAADGDTILVENGYSSEGQISISKNNLTLVAEGNVTLKGLNGKPVLKIVADYVTIEGFIIQNGSVGISVAGYGNNIRGNIILNNSRGIELYNSLNCIISLNNITVPPKSFIYAVGEEYGILLRGGSSNNTVRMNEIDGLTPCLDTYGIALSQSSKNIVSLNNLSRLHYGIMMALSSNNTLISNTATDNWSGIVLDASPYNTMRNNTMANNNANFGVRLDYLGSPWRAINDIDASNTVNGKPIYYWVNKFDTSVPLDGGCVVLVNCGGIKIQNLNLSNNFHGILMINTNNTQICSNNIMSNVGLWEFFCGGIWTLSSSNNVISLNNISDNSDGVFVLSGVNNRVLNNIVDNNLSGIVIKWASNCTVSSNKVTSSRYTALGVCLSYSKGNVVDSNDIASDRAGVIISESDNVISSNRITGCSIGISLHTGTSNCIIRSNNIIASKDYAVHMSKAYNNIFFHNNFMGNTKVYDKGGSVNVWDNGYPSGGNYWSDYAGVDLCHGPNQDIVGSDGIGDTSYVIRAYDRDRYPLMKPYPWDPHDVGITSMSLSKTVVGQGFDLHINLTIFNYGNNTETLSVTAYTNTTILQTKSITIGSRNFTIVTFTWNTTGVAKGNYTITAKATPVPGETDTDDNRLTDGIVKVTIPGDITGDFKVDVCDFCILYILAYGSRPGDWNWIPEADINNDGAVNNLDRLILWQNIQLKPGEQEIIKLLLRVYHKIHIR